MLFLLFHWLLTNTALLLSIILSSRVLSFNPASLRAAEVGFEKQANVKENVSFFQERHYSLFTCSTELKKTFSLRGHLDRNDGEPMMTALRLREPSLL